MINILFTTVPISFDNSGEAFDPLYLQFKQIAEWVSPLAETKTVNGRIMVQGIIPDEQSFLMLKGSLEAMGKAPKIVWKGSMETGLQEGYIKVNTGTEDEPVYEVQRDTVNFPTIDYPFDIAEYASFLHGSKTEAEAENIQVNKFAGMPNRDLKSYV